MSRKEDLADSLLKEQQQEKLKALQRDFEVTFATPEGKNVLKHIMQLCGYQRTSVIGNSQIGLSVLEGTLHNEAQRSVYLKIRQHLPKHILIDVELN